MDVGPFHVSDITDYVSALCVLDALDRKTQRIIRMRGIDHRWCDNMRDELRRWSYSVTSEWPMSYAHTRK